MDTWTTEKREQFLASLRDNPNVTLAANAANMARSGAYALRERDPEFAKQWDDALEHGVDMLEAEVHRRAKDGVDKPITYQGEITGTFKEYSDTLAIFLLKAHKPERFRDRQSVEMTGRDGGPIAISDQEAGAKLAAILEAARRRKVEDDLDGLV